jgi:hypothetical protein
MLIKSEMKTNQTGLMQDVEHYVAFIEIFQLKNCVKAEYTPCTFGRSFHGFISYLLFKNKFFLVFLLKLYNLQNKNI